MNHEQKYFYFLDVKKYGLFRAKYFFATADDKISQFFSELLCFPAES